MLAHMDKYLSSSHILTVLNVYFKVTCEITFTIIAHKYSSLNKNNNNCLA